MRIESTSSMTRGDDRRSGFRRSLKAKAGHLPCKRRLYRATRESLPQVQIPTPRPIRGARDRIITELEVRVRTALSQRSPASTGPWTRASMRLQPCSRAGDSTPRNMARSHAPCIERNLPELFMDGLIAPKSHRCKLFVKSVPGSCGRRSISILKARKRDARL